MTGVQTCALPIYILEPRATLELRLSLERINWYGNVTKLGVPLLRFEICLKSVGHFAGVCCSAISMQRSSSFATSAVRSAICALINHITKARNPTLTTTSKRNAGGKVDSSRPLMSIVLPTMVLGAFSTANRGRHPPRVF